MNVLLISRCTKRARDESCRILDRFAERKGDGAWQTTITLEGLHTLRRLLRKTARRNTAVACHWLKKSGQTELIWIVGNLRRFNAQGSVPTNRTSKDIVCSQQEHHWHSAESIALLAAIAGLFHDFGKASRLFQEGLRGQAKYRYQPFRHEWVSVRLFQAFVGQQTDRQWIASLGGLNIADEARWLARCRTDTLTDTDSPLCGLPPLAQVVAWLIVSHHRLPQFLPASGAPDLAYAGDWLQNQFNADWNALNRHRAELPPQTFKTVWQFPQGTPLRSKTWRDKARQIARRAANAPSLFTFGVMEQLFTLHMARLALMLADHYYSARAPFPHWQDDNFSAWANTERATRCLKQKLDEHIVGVSHNALLLGRALPWTQRSLPAIARHKGFRERAGNPRFYWQN